MKRPVHILAPMLLGAIMVFGLTNGALAAKQSEVLNFEEAVSGIDRILVSNINGDIKISGTKTDMIRIEAKRRIEGDSEEAIKRFAEEFYPKITRQDGRLKIETQYPDDNDEWQDEIDETTIDYVIVLPPDFNVKVESINGDVTIAEVTGSAQAETVNGEITIESHGNSNKDVDASSVNGEIRVSVTGLSERSSFETVNGEIMVSVSKELLAAINAETVNGEVRMSLPESANFTIEAEIGLNGSIETDWGNSDDDHSFMGDDFQVDVNGGGNKVSIETLNGEIEVRGIKS